MPELVIPSESLILLHAELSSAPIAPPESTKTVPRLRSPPSDALHSDSANFDWPGVGATASA